MEARNFSIFLVKWLTSKLYKVNLHPVKIPIKGDCICLIDQKISNIISILTYSRSKLFLNQSFKELKSTLKSIM